MGNGFGKFTNVRENEQLLLENKTGRILIDKPTSCFNYFCWTTSTKVKQLVLKNNEWATITNEIQPEHNRIVFGPSTYRLQSPYEKFGEVRKCWILDYDEYIIVTSSTGMMRTVVGPVVFKPNYNETWTNVNKSILVNINEYIMVWNNNDINQPIQHIRGPTKFIPEPHQKLFTNPETKNFIWKCIETTDIKGCIIKKADGTVFLIDKPQFYMLDVGESLLGYVDKTIINKHEFCIIKDPDGKIVIFNGNNPDNRSFFLKPFHSFVEFNIENKTKHILSTLPAIIPYVFVIRTLDNVSLELDIKITYQIFDTLLFGSNPFDFYTHIINWFQNELLNLFVQVNLQDFMKSYLNLAFSLITKGSEYFANFGIKILDIQIINYTCKNPVILEFINQYTKTQIELNNQLEKVKKECEIFEIKKKSNLGPFIKDFMDSLGDLSNEDKVKIWLCSSK